MDVLLYTLLIFPILISLPVPAWPIRVSSLAHIILARVYTASLSHRLVSVRGDLLVECSDFKGFKGKELGLNLDQ